MDSRHRPLRVSIVGAGKVGTTLAIMLHRSGFRVVSVVSAHRRAAQRCARLVDCTSCATQIESIAADTELLVITVPDDKIRNVAQEISAHPTLVFRRLKIFHTSGSLTSDELEPLRRKGAITFSLHPIQTFPKTLPLDIQLKSMPGISYGVEGTSRAIAFARNLVRKLDGRIFVVPKKEKILYHLACVFASNYSVALMAVVDELGFHITKASQLRHFKRLVETSIRNAFRYSPQRGLTGPISRGSKKTIEAHVRALRGKPLLRDIYRALGIYAAKLSRQAGRLTKRQQRELERILSNKE